MLLPSLTSLYITLILTIFSNTWIPKMKNCSHVQQQQARNRQWGPPSARVRRPPAGASRAAEDAGGRWGPWKSVEDWASEVISWGLYKQLMFVWEELRCFNVWAKTVTSKWLGRLCDCALFGELRCSSVGARNALVWASLCWCSYGRIAVRVSVWNRWCFCTYVQVLVFYRAGFGACLCLRQHWQGLGGSARFCSRCMIFYLFMCACISFLWVCTSLLLLYIFLCLYPLFSFSLSPFCSSLSSCSEPLSFLSLPRMCVYPAASFNA